MARFTHPLEEAHIYSTLKAVLVALIATFALLLVAAPAQAAPGPYPPNSIDYGVGRTTCNDGVFTYDSNLTFNEATVCLAVKSGIVADRPVCSPYPQSSYIQPGSTMKWSAYQFGLGGFGCTSTTYYIGRTETNRWGPRDVMTYLNVYRPNQRIHCVWTAWVHEDRAPGTSNGSRITVNSPTVHACGGF